MTIKNAFAKCLVSECNNKYHAKGYCAIHYAKFVKYGDPEFSIIKTKHGEPYEWLLSHIDFKDDDCLKWPYATDKHGRGTVFDKNGKSWQAHRLMCILAHGEPSLDNLEAAHNCGKGHEGCVNPKHLRWSTKLENHADKYNHRSFPNSVTLEKANEIYSYNNILSARKTAEKFNVSPSTVDKIFNRTHWIFKMVNKNDN